MFKFKKKEVMLYVTRLSDVVNRNDMADVFLISEGKKNRCFMDQPTTLEDGYKKKPVAILDDLVVDMPEGLRALKNIIPMHTYFLTPLLQK